MLCFIFHVYSGIYNRNYLHFLILTEFFIGKYSTVQLCKFFFSTSKCIFSRCLVLYSTILGMLMVMVMTGYNRSWPWPISVGQRFLTDRLTDRRFNRGLTAAWLTGFDRGLNFIFKIFYNSIFFISYINLIS